MPKTRIFHTHIHGEIQKQIVGLLNSQPDFLSTRTAASTRAAGDAIQAIISEHFQSLLGECCAEYSATFARRVMADLAFTDTDGFYHVVDVKTHRQGTQFNMPNITSVERLSRFYEDDMNYFVLLMVKYAVTETKVRALECYFIPIEFLSWECLTIGALGWGQIQIANANVISIRENYPRKKWMLELCDIMLDFYPREIRKIAARTDYCEKVRERWLLKPDE